MRYESASPNPGPSPHPRTRDSHAPLTPLEPALLTQRPLQSPPPLLLVLLMLMILQPKSPPTASSPTRGAVPPPARQPPSILSRELTSGGVWGGNYPSLMRLRTSPRSCARQPVPCGTLFTARDWSRPPSLSVPPLPQQPIRSGGMAALKGRCLSRSLNLQWTMQSDNPV